MKSSLASALAIAILLLIAAISKWLNPTNLPYSLDRAAAIIEILAAILIPIFHRRANTWIALTALFSLWLGYTLFWFIENKNCGCFGNSFYVSPGITTVVDAIVIGLSFWNWGNIEKGARKKMIFILVDGLLLIIGFLIAAWMNNL